MPGRGSGSRTRWKDATGKRHACVHHLAAAERVRHQKHGLKVECLIHNRGRGSVHRQRHTSRNIREKYSFKIKE